jgi:hypothetical protein
VSEASFWLVPQGAAAELATERARYRPGEPLVLRYRQAPGNRYDWIGLFPADGSPPEAGRLLLWQHLRGRVAGEIRFDRAVNEGTWPLPPGRYVAWLLEDDGYRTLARAELGIEDPRPSEVP